MARTTWQRFIGLMGRKNLEMAFLLIPRCRSVHTCFMRGPIDLVFLDGDRRVVGVRRAITPWRLAFGPATATSTLELPPHFSERRHIEPGDTIECPQN